MTLYNQWIEALGHYPCTKEALHDDYGFCCLGVVCDIKDPNLWKKFYRVDDLTVVYRYSNAGLYKLPIEIQKELQLATDLGHFQRSELPGNLLALLDLYYIHANDDDGSITLAMLNDQLPTELAFPIIKQVLEARPPSLFI